ncbi:MAG TPA: CPBP family intramembrane glutamic endopeptidase [Pirellulales bacterium]|nr:CPBP family intramembrane glutamic endopeptidase [Pirellulales bacterium]
MADAAEPPLTRADWLAIAAALAFPTLATWAYFIALAGSPAMNAAYALTKLLQFSFPLVWVVLWQRRRVRLTAPAPAGVGIGLALGLAVLAGMLGLYYGFLKASPAMARTPAQAAEKLTEFGIDAPLKFFAFAAFLTVLHSLMEEYYWRWFVFGQLSRGASFGLAATVSSLGFMAHHVLVIGEYFPARGVYVAFFSLCVAVGGFLWAWLYRRTGSLYGPWASHLVVDAGLMWLGYDLWQTAARSVAS